MKPRTVLVLALVVAALAAFLWFVERDLPSSEELAERARKVLPVEADEVRALAVEWDGRAVRLERAPAPGAGGGGDAGDDGEDDAPSGEWRLTEPLRARADRAAVDGLLTALTGLDKIRTLEDADPAELTRLGLEPPRGRVTLVTGEGERTLLVGAEVPASENVLVSLAGAPEVWVTPRSFTARLDKEPGDWRSKEVLAVTRDEIGRVTLRRGPEAPASAVVLVRGEDDRFRLAEPMADLADVDLVSQMLSDLVTLRAQRFLDEPGLAPGDLGLDPPRGVVEAELEGGGERIRVELGAPLDGEEADGDGVAVYARAVAGEEEAQLFEAVTGLDEAVARPPAEWRSPSWTALGSFEVDRLEVAEPGRPELVLAREGVAWRRGGEEIGYTAASDLLFALTDADGEVADGAGGDLGEPVLTVLLLAEEGDGETLALYPELDGRHPATSSAREAVVLLPGEAVAGTREALEGVRAAEPVEEDE